ncbi:MAG: hypothetical protein GX176_04285 [Syntrophomonadaceae bacterium]|jgi:hypothetical protein|nr:hypothetical protein [Syntrophomonadaceae bacterium]HQA50451.1 hypothetical protein [Syntrophomonadaceae bacterium]HQD90159.1 hypothetical protein [Syntrophomonadaceae bacterium]
MLASVNTLVLTGIEASTVQVEVDIHSGLPGFEKVGNKNLITVNNY